MTARILVLEDDPDLRATLCEALGDEGHEVADAARGEDAVAMAARGPFDLVVVDIRMDGMDGLEALERMRVHQPHARSLVITGYSSEEQMMRAVRLGVGDYLKKPFSLRDFLERVSTLLSSTRQSETQAAASRQLRRMAVWALQSLAATLDGLDVGHRRESAGHHAAALAISLGLDAEAVIAIRIGALGAAIIALDDADALLGWDEHALLSEVIATIDERWDGRGPKGVAGSDIPLSARIAAVALALALAQDEPSATAAERLRQDQPGRFDPRVLGCMATSRPPPSGEVSSRLRGLLLLGRALEARGDREGAQRAFSWIVRDGAEAREAVDARHRLAALAVAAGHVDDAVRHADAALEVARRLGPVTAASAGLDAAVTLLSACPARAKDIVEETLLVAVDLHLEVIAARARLVLGSLGVDGPFEHALHVLSQPENTSERALSAHWLLPFTLERVGTTPSPAATRAAVLLVRDFPAHVQRLIDRGALSPAGRRAVAEALAGQGGEAARAVLARLGADPDAEVRRAAVASLQERSREAEVPLLRAHAFGGFEVYRGEVRIDESAWHTQKTKWLFAYLLAHAQRPVSDERIIELFWDGDVEKGKRGVYAATSTLRRVLDLAHESEGGRHRWIVRTGSMLQIDPAVPLWHDLDEFEKTLAEARQLERDGHGALSLDRLRRAVSVYRGPYLEGCYLDWALERRERIEAEVLAALMRLADFSLEAGQVSQAIEFAGRVLEVDACHQDACAIAMQGHVVQGRSQDAIRLFERVERSLKRELDVDPSIRLVELYHKARLA